MIVVVLAVKMPVRADADPLGTSPSAQDTLTVQMYAYALVATPGPARATVQAVVEAILSPQLPLVANLDPATTVPPLVGAHAVLVSTDAPVLSSPEPAASLV